MSEYFYKIKIKIIIIFIKNSSLYVIILFDSITKGVSYLDYDKERVRVNSVRDHAISNITNPESENGTLISDKEQKLFLKELQIAMDEMKKNSK